MFTMKIHLELVLHTVTVIEFYTPSFDEILIILMCSFNFEQTRFIYSFALNCIGKKFSIFFSLLYLEQKL